MSEMNIPQTIQKRAEFYVNLSRKKEAEGNLSEALSNLIKAENEDFPINKEFYEAEKERLQKSITPVDPALKAEIAQLYREVALIDEDVDEYERADSAAESLVKQLAKNEPAAEETLNALIRKTGNKSETLKTVLIFDDKDAGTIYKTEPVEKMSAGHNAPYSREIDDTEDEGLSLLDILKKYLTILSKSSNYSFYPNTDYASGCALLDKMNIEINRTQIQNINVSNAKKYLKKAMNRGKANILAILSINIGDYNHYMMFTNDFFYDIFREDLVMDDISETGFDIAIEYSEMEYLNLIQKDTTWYDLEIKDHEDKEGSTHYLSFRSDMIDKNVLVKMLRAIKKSVD